MNWISSFEFASDNFLHVSWAFAGSDFCHLFTAPTIDGVDDPPVPGSPNNFGKHHNYCQQTVIKVFAKSGNLKQTKKLLFEKEKEIAAKIAPFLP